MKDSLVAQLIKNPPAMQETPVTLLSWEDPLEKGSLLIRSKKTNKKGRCINSPLHDH